MKRLNMTTWLGPLTMFVVGVSVQWGVAGAVDFEHFTVLGGPYVLGEEQYYSGFDAAPYPPNNSSEEHPFTAAGVEFYNSHIVGEYGAYWEGWAVSNMTDTTTPGYVNQYSAITGGGVCGSPNYGLAYLPDNSWWGGDPATEVFRRAPIEAAHTDIQGFYGVYVTNTTYAYLSMSGGDQFGHEYSSEFDDYLCLSITGLDEQGAAIPELDPVDFYLADFRSNRPPDAVAGDYIIDHWAWVDVSRLVTGGADQLQFLFSSSDTGDYGINTPLYFAMDNLPSIPGDASLDGVVGQVDVLILSSNWGEQNAHWVEGDFNADGTVGPADAALLAANWGKSVPAVGEASSHASAPEPGQVVLLVGTVITLAAGRRRRRRCG